MNKKIDVQTPFGEAMAHILGTITKNYTNKCAFFSVRSLNRGDVFHVDVSVYSDSTQNMIIEKGQAHCTWTRQFYPEALIMDINTLLEDHEKGVKPAPKRTFAEIVKELKDKLGEFWSIGELRKDFAVLVNRPLIFIIVHVNGRLEIDHRCAIALSVSFFAPQLAAISAACSEIAANYQAEHGKEGA